jgi:hypothetical protein
VFNPQVTGAKPLQVHVNPHAAKKIAGRFMEQVPDDLVPAAFDLANRLQLRRPQQDLVARMHKLVASSSSGVQLATVDEIVAMMNRRRSQAEEAITKHRNGHLPIHAVAQFLNGGVVGTHLVPHLIGDDEPTNRRGVVARYGRRYDEGIWPKELANVTLYLDITALLTAHAIGLLERAELAFQTITLAADSLTTIDHLRSAIDVAQPSRIAAMREILQAVASGKIVEGAETKYQVTWENVAADNPEKLALNFSRLIEAATGNLQDHDRIESIQSELGATLSPEPQGPTPPKDSVVLFEPGISVALAEARALEIVAVAYQPAISPEEVEQLKRDIADAEFRGALIGSLTALHRRISDGLNSGKYAFAPVQPTQTDDPLMRSIGQLVGAMERQPGILWIDDRFITAFPQFNAVSTAEVVKALVDRDEISATDGFCFRQQLRKANWLFMPIDAAELTSPLRGATRDGEVRETSDLALLRRSAAVTLLNRRLIQWPNPNEIDEEVRGEVPHLLDNSHSISEALSSIWKDPTWTVSDAEAASQWLIENIDLNLFPYSVIPDGDPRADHLLGVHLGSLALTGLQILPSKELPSKRRRERQAAFLEWLWGSVIAETLRIRPDCQDGMIAMIEGHITELHFEPQLQNLEKKLAANLLNAMPLRMRELLMDRPKIRQYFDLPGHYNITIGGHDFDEREFWTAVSKCLVNKVKIVEDTTGAKAKITFSNSDADAHIAISVGQERMRLDPWPKRVCDDHSDVRLAALKADPDELDLSDTELEKFNAVLQSLNDPADRIMQTTAKIRAAAGYWYSEFARSVRDRESFQIGQITPESAGGIARLLRVEAADLGLGTAAARLIAGRGLKTAIARLSSLPIEPPAELVRFGRITRCAGRNGSC